MTVGRPVCEKCTGNRGGKNGLGTSCTFPVYRPTDRPAVIVTALLRECHLICTDLLSNIVAMRFATGPTRRQDITKH
jgi:hypothetical protein